MKYLILLFLFTIMQVKAEATWWDGEEVEKIVAQTNLRYRQMIDTVGDYMFEDYWSFGGQAYSRDLFSASDEYVAIWKDHNVGMRTAWLLEQAERGRMSNLGTYVPYWTQQPSKLVAELSQAYKWGGRFELYEGDDNNWIILTDMEPDDRVALMLLSQLVPREKILAVGVGLKNAGLKATLARRLLRQVGWGGVPVFQGNGGPESSYPDFASNAAARTYEREGTQVLSDRQLARARRLPTSALDVQAFIQGAVNVAHREKKKINILALSPLTDLANAVLSYSKYPDTLEAIGRVVMVGGYVETPSESGPQLRSTYNWNMDPISAQIVLQRLQNITLFSSHIIKPAFGGGSLNRANAPEVIALLKYSPGQAFRDFSSAGRNWDEHLISKIPPLAGIIGPYVGEQFTPADVLAAAYVADPQVVTATEPVNMRLNLDSRTERGVLTELQDGLQPHKLVNVIDKERFSDVLKSGLGRLANKSCEWVFVSSQRR